MNWVAGSNAVNVQQFGSCHRTLAQVMFTNQYFSKEQEVFSLERCRGGFRNYGRFVGRYASILPSTPELQPFL